MSLGTKYQNSIPAETVQVAKAAFPHGNAYMELRDELGSLYTDAEFADLYLELGRGVESPAEMAIVSVLQYAENLSDRQAADQVRSRIDWKYLLGLELEDAGFDYSLLCDFRTRLVGQAAGQRLLDHLLMLFSAHGLLNGKGKQRTDSTHVLAAVRELNRLELVGESLRYALNELAQLAPEWLQSRVPREWYERYGTRFEAYRLPKTEAERQALALRIGQDGRQLLLWLGEGDAPAEWYHQAAVRALWAVWVQNYYQEGEQLSWRDHDQLPPSELQIRSPYDVEARFSRKRDQDWVGYKAHFTECCETDCLHAITHVLTQPATTPDWSAPGPIYQDLAKLHLLPDEHYLDAGYVDVGNLVTGQEQGVDLIGPVPPDTAWQARKHPDFALARFLIDWEHQQAICPQGQRSQIWATATDRYGKPTVDVRFPKTACQACCVRSQCTRSATARSLKLYPQRWYVALQQARQRQLTPEFRQAYQRRAGIEGTLSQGVRAFDLRRARYIGLAKTHLQHLLTAVAINLARCAAWLLLTPLAQTRASPFAALNPTLL